jgi:hypothetical protein
MGRLFIICAERIINSKPKKTGHIYRERIRPTYSTPYVGQVLPQELKQEKHREHKAHRSAHPQRAGRAGAGRTHAPQPQHHADAPQAGQARQGTGHTTGQGHSTTQKHSTQKKEQESTQEYIEVCYSSSVEHKGTDHTVTPNHSTCSPQRGHGTRHQSLRCVLFCVQAGHGIAVGTTQTQNAMRGEEGAAFLPIK